MRCGAQVRLPRGSRLFTRGDPTGGVYFLTAGAVDVTTSFETVETFSDEGVRMRPLPPRRGKRGSLPGGCC